MATAKAPPTGKPATAPAQSAAKTSPPGKPTAPGAAPPAQPDAPAATGEVPADGQQEPEKEVPKPNVKTMAVVEYLGMVDKLLKQGLEVLVVERPENPVEFLSIFLKENDTQKKPPQFYKTGPPPPKSACGCRPGPPLPPTSCGCFHEPGWEPNLEFPPVGWPDLTSIEYVEAIDSIALP